MIKRSFVALALLCAITAAMPARAQNTTTFGNIVSPGTPCGASNCVYYQLPPGTPWVVITVTGTWTGTLETATSSAPNANYSNLNTIAWAALATEKANGTWSAATSGATYLRVRATSWTSGSAHVAMASSQVGSPQVNPAMPGTLTIAGMQDPAGGSATSCWATDGTQTVCAGAGTGAVQVAPSGSQTVTQPSATTFGANSLNWAYYASQYQTPAGTGNNGIANLFGSAACAGGCDVVADPGYAYVDRPGFWQGGILSNNLLSSGSMFHDTRKGINFYLARNPPVSNFTNAYDHNFFGCLMDSLVGDTVGSPQLGGNCVYTLSNDTVPGWSYGALALPNHQGWYTHGLGLVEGYSNAAGIKNGFTVNLNCYGIGDCNLNGSALRGKGGRTANSDQGYTGNQVDVFEVAPYTGTAAASYSGTGPLALTCGSDCSSYGTGMPLIDKTTGVLSGTGVATVNNGFVIINTSFTVPVSTAVTLVGTLDALRTANNTGSTQTFTVTTAADLTPLVGKVAKIMGQLAETFVVSSVGAFNAPVAGQQTITANIRHGYSAGTAIYIGGAAGMYLEQTAATQIVNGATYRYLLDVVGSPGANTLVAASLLTGNVANPSYWTNPTYSFTGTTASASTTITAVSSTTGLVVGQTVVGAGIPAGDTITAIGSGTITLIAAATASTASVALTSSLAENVALYNGAEIYSAQDPVTVLAKGTSALIEPLSITIASGDAIEVPNHISFGGNSLLLYSTIQNPYTRSYTPLAISMAGLGHNGSDSIQITNSSTGVMGGINFSGTYKQAIHMVTAPTTAVLDLSNLNSTYYLHVGSAQNKIQNLGAGGYSFTGGVVNFDETINSVNATIAASDPANSNHYGKTTYYGNYGNNFLMNCDEQPNGTSAFTTTMYLGNSNTGCDFSRSLRANNIHATSFLSENTPTFTALPPAQNGTAVYTGAAGTFQHLYTVFGINANGVTALSGNGVNPNTPAGWAVSNTVQQLDATHYITLTCPTAAQMTGFTSVGIAEVDADNYPGYFIATCPFSGTFVDNFSKAGVGTGSASAGGAINPVGSTVLLHTGTLDMDGALGQGLRFNSPKWAYGSNNNAGVSNSAIGTVSIDGPTARDGQGAIVAKSASINGSLACTANGANCPASGTTVASPQFQISYYSAAGTATTLTGDSKLVTDGVGNLSVNSLAVTGLAGSDIYTTASTYNYRALLANSVGLAEPVTGGTSYLLQFPNTAAAGVVHTSTATTIKGALIDVLSYGAVSLTTEVSGVLPAANGGSSLGGAPTCSNVVFGTGAGTTPSCTSVAGLDGSHFITIATGTTPAASSIIFTFTFTATRGHLAYCSLNPVPFSEFTVLAQIPFQSGASATSYVAESGSTALTASTSYTLIVECP